MAIAFCINCGANEPVKMDSLRIEAEVRGVKISYVETRAICPECGEELYLPEVNDENVRAREAAYRKAAKLITVDEIKKIISKYQIGAGPLAQVMGFGEITINRYLNGQLPFKANSDKLLEVLSSHKKMAENLELRKGSISDVAYRKCRSSLDELDELYGNGKIEIVTRYLLNSISDITPLALQKLLYYVQAFFFALFREDIFSEPCQAWAHGPVYPKVYQKYKIYGYNPIEQSGLDADEFLSELTTKEIELIDAVIASFGRYSGSILEKMTHSEKPWREARGNLLPSDRSSREIKQDTIHEYFQTIVKTYNIVNPCDIINYSDALFMKM